MDRKIDGYQARSCIRPEGFKSSSYEFFVVKKQLINLEVLILDASQIWQVYKYHRYGRFINITDMVDL